MRLVLLSPRRRRWFNLHTCLSITTVVYCTLVFYLLMYIWNWFTLRFNSNLIFLMIYLGRMCHFKTFFTNALFVVNEYLTSYLILKVSLIYDGGKIVSRIRGTRSPTTRLPGSPRGT